MAASQPPAPDCVPIMVPKALVGRVQDMILAHEGQQSNMEFLEAIERAAENRTAVTREDVARLRRLADWADTPPPPGWNGSLDRGEARRAVAAARKRMG